MVYQKGMYSIFLLVKSIRKGNVSVHWMSASLRFHPCTFAHGCFFPILTMSVSLQIRFREVLFFGLPAAFSGHKERDSMLCNTLSL